MISKMNKYKFGLIYTLYSKEQNIQYIGSTTGGWSRIVKHLNESLNDSKKKCTSSLILECPDHEVDILEHYPCNSKQELEGREGYWIQQFNNCVNEQIAGGKDAIHNKKHTNEIIKKWRQSEKGKQYVEQSKEKEKWKAWYKHQYANMEWMRTLRCNSLQIFPMSKEENTNRKRRIKEKWRLQKKYGNNYWKNISPTRKKYYDAKKNNRTIH